VAEALQRMREMGLRRMPVADEAGRLVGLVAIDDLVDYLASLLGDVAGAIRNEQRIERSLRT
jgi:CBS domain-containing protein